MSEITEIENRRKILTANHNLTNCINHEEFIDLAIDTFSIIEDYLMSSYGKQSTNTLIIYDHSIQSINVFTTDGIHKLQSLEFMSPIQNYLIEHIRYIGECTEKKAGDGTTTGMLFCVMLLKNIFKYKKYLLEHITDKNNIQIFLYEFSEKIIEKLTTLKNHTQKLVIKLDQLDKSHYDKYIKSLIKVTSKNYYEDMKNIIIPMVENLDTNFYEYFGYNKTEIETKKAISLADNDYDYVTNIQINYGQEYFNQNSNTTFEDIVDVIVIPKIIDNISMTYPDIWKYISEKNKNLEDHIINKSTIVFLYKFCNYDVITDISKRFTNINFIFVQYMHYIPDIYESCIELHGLIHSTKFNNSNILKNIKVKIEFNNIYLYNIFDYDKDRKYVNALYYNKNNLKFNKWEEEITNLIKYIKDKYTKTDINNLIKEYTHIYKKIIIPKYPNIIIGGRSLDHLELIDIVEDTIGNIASVFNNGILVNYYIEIISYIKNNLINTGNKLITDFNELCDISLKSNNYDIFIDCIIIQIFQQFNISKDLTNYNDKGILNARTIYEMYNRSIDIIPKLIKTTNIVVPGTININKDK